MTRPPASAGTRLPHRLIIAILVAGMLGVVLTTYDTLRASTRLVDAKQRYADVQQLYNEILRDDEVLTMSARQAVAEALIADIADEPARALDPHHWRARYETTELALADRLAALTLLVGDIPALIELRDRTSAANDALVAMERAALDAKTPPTLERARDVLDGDEYRRQKELYASNMEALIDAMARHVTAQVDAEQASVRAALPIAATLALLIALIGIVALRALTRWQQRFEERVEQAAALAATRLSDNAVLLRELLSAEQQERARLGQLMHDDLQQHLVSARLFARTAHELAAQGEAAIEPPLTRAVEQLDAAIDSARNLHRALRQPSLDDMTLAQALDELVARSPLDVELVVDVLDHAPLEPTVVQLVWRAVQELLLNATKYAGVDAARVEVRVTAEGRLTLVVRDHGAGFDPAKAADGTGLGDLRRRVETIGGRLDIESAPGDGTRITLHIPEARSKRPASTAPPPARPAPPDAPLRVLIVDDHLALRQNTLRLLTRDGRFEVVGVVSTPADGIAAATALAPDAVVLDHMMPGMDGDAVARRILAEHPATRVVGYSAIPDEARPRMHAAGVAAVVDKGSDPDALIAALLGAPDAG